MIVFIIIISIIYIYFWLLLVVGFMLGFIIIQHKGLHSLDLTYKLK